MIYCLGVLVTVVIFFDCLFVSVDSNNDPSVSKLLSVIDYI